MSDYNDNIYYTVRVGTLFGTGRSAWEAITDAFHGDKIKASRFTERVTQRAYRWNGNAMSSDIESLTGIYIGFIEKSPR